jgi:hypothetical protein
VGVPEGFVEAAVATVFAAGVAIAVPVAAGVVLPSPPPPHAALSTVPAVTTHNPMPAHRFKKECILVLPSCAVGECLLARLGYDTMVGLCASGCS